MPSDTTPKLARLRTRWGAIGAAIAVTLGGGGFGLAQASVATGDKPVTVNVDPGRALDTRFDIGLTGAFASATPRDLEVTGEIDVATPDNQTEKRTVIPEGASAALVNVTVVAPTDQGFLALRSGGAAGEPSTSTVNFQPLSVEPNAATVALSADGELQVYVFMPTPGARADVLIDIVGYTIDHNHDDRYYTKSQVDAGTASLNADIATKADAAAVFNKGQTYNRAAIDAAIDSAVAPKADSANIYTKAQVYTKTQVDALVPGTGSETMTLTGWDFHGNGTDPMRYQTGGCGYNDLGGGLRGSVQIPVGATITGMTAVVLDNNASDATLEILVSNNGVVTSVGSLTTSGATPGVQTGLTATITPTTVEATGYVFMYFGSTTASSLQLCGVQVEYDLI